MNNIFQNPTIRIVIVVIIVTAISMGIVFIVRGLLTNDLNCKDGTHASPDNTKCFPNCDKGYKNDPETGKCILDCPDGQVPIKEIDPRSEGLNRCVQPCGESYCDITKDPDSVCVITSGKPQCQIPNCHTTDKKLSYCPPGNCGIGADGKPKRDVPDESTFDKAGCVKKSGRDCRPGQKLISSISPPAPTYTICCDPSDEFALRNDTTGDVACCPKSDEKVIGKNQCCPANKYCTWTVGEQKKFACANSKEVCIEGGPPCLKDNATYTIVKGKKKYTGCCPSPVINGKCKNLCMFPSSKMKELKKSKCQTSADCVGDTGEIGVCRGGNCVLSCGGIDDNDVCLNDTIKKVSTCYHESKSCEFDMPQIKTGTGGETDSGIYFCADSVSKSPNPSYAWGGKDARWQLTMASSFKQSQPGCNKLSCLNRFATKGLLSSTISKTTSTDNRQITFTYPENLKMNFTDTDRLCTATIDCNLMKITNTKGGESISFNEQKPPPTQRSIKISKNEDGNYNGRWTGGENDLCNPSLTTCKYLSDKRYAPFGTYDGSSDNLSEIRGPISGSGCQPAQFTSRSAAEMNSVYKNNVLCKVETTPTTSGIKITPTYFCPVRGSCCGYAALPGNSFKTHGICTSFQAARKINDSSYVWSTINGYGNKKAIVFSYNWVITWDIKQVENLQNLSILNIRDSYNTNPQTYRWKMASSYNQFTALWSNAIVIMKSVNKGKYINFTKKTGDSSDGVLRLTSDANSTINFYYSMVDFSGDSNVRIWGQIPLLAGMLRWGKSTDFADYDDNRRQENFDVGRPVKVTQGGAAELDSQYMRHFIGPHPTKLPKNGFVTIVEFENIYYLAMVSIWWQKKGYSEQIFSNKKIYYASESDDGAILFNVEGTPGQKPPDGSMKITLETVLSYNRDKINSNQDDDQMLKSLKIQDLMFRITGCNLSGGICKPTTKTNLPTIKEVLDDLRQSV